MRDRLRLKAGDRVEFVVQADGTALMVPATLGLDDLEGVPPPPRKPVSLDEMDRVLRRRAGWT